MKRLLVLCLVLFAVPAAADTARFDLGGIADIQVAVPQGFGPVIEGRGIAVRFYGQSRAPMAVQIYASQNPGNLGLEQLARQKAERWRDSALPGGRLTDRGSVTMLGGLKFWQIDLEGARGPVAMYAQVSTGFFMGQPLMVVIVGAADDVRAQWSGITMITTQSKVVAKTAQPAARPGFGTGPAVQPQPAQPARPTEPGLGPASAVQAQDHYETLNANLSGTTVGLRALVPAGWVSRASEGRVFMIQPAGATTPVVVVGVSALSQTDVAGKTTEQIIDGFVAQASAVGTITARVPMPFAGGPGELMRVDGKENGKAFNLTFVCSVQGPLLYFAMIVGGPTEVEKSAEPIGQIIAQFERGGMAGRNAVLPVAAVDEPAWGLRVTPPPGVRVAWSSGRLFFSRSDRASGTIVVEHHWKAEAAKLSKGGQKVQLGPHAAVMGTLPGIGVAFFIFQGGHATAIIPIPGSDPSDDAALLASVAGVLELSTPRLQSGSATKVIDLGHGVRVDLPGAWKLGTVEAGRVQFNQSGASAEIRSVVGAYDYASLLASFRLRCVNFGGTLTDAAVGSGPLSGARQTTCLPGPQSAAKLGAMQVTLLQRGGVSSYLIVAGGGKKLPAAADAVLGGLVHP